jgi:hypothetical protein
MISVFGVSTELRALLRVSDVGSSCCAILAISLQSVEDLRPEMLDLGDAFLGEGIDAGLGTQVIILEPLTVRGNPLEIGRDRMGHLNQTF